MLRLGQVETGAGIETVVAVEAGAGVQTGMGMAVGAGVVCLTCYQI